MTHTGARSTRPAGSRRRTRSGGTPRWESERLRLPAARRRKRTEVAHLLHPLPCDVGADRLVGTNVAGLPVTAQPLRSLVVVMDIENLREQLEVPLPAHAGRRRDEANRASARHLIVREELLDQVAVADEVD